MNIGSAIKIIDTMIGLYGEDHVVEMQFGDLVGAAVQAVAEACGDAVKAGNEVIHPRALTQNFLRLGLIVPEIRVFRPRVQLRRVFDEVFIVKDTSQAARGSLRIGLSGL